MSKKSDIKHCRYQQCKHDTNDIDITCDEYVVKGSMYYHKDCYKAKVNGEWKDEATKADLQLIKNLWFEHISKTVVYSQLFRVLNDFIERGVKSDYLVFVMNYVIENKLNLNYPAGFKYFVDKKEIKDAYAKKVNTPKGYDRELFSIKEKENEEPKFTVSKKSIGFNKILGGK